MTALIRIKKVTYHDQHGIIHSAYRIIDTAEVTCTGDSISYQYYTETIRDPLYEDDKKRLWRCRVATDYGCPSTWSRTDPETMENIEPRELWVPASRSSYGTTPIIGEVKEENHTCSVLSGEMNYLVFAND